MSIWICIDALPVISQRVSNAINLTTDAIALELEGISDRETEDLLPLFKEHLPQTISNIAFQDVRNTVPAEYIKNAISSCLASKLVYKEGCNFINSLPKERLARTAMEYVAKEKEISMLQDALQETDMEEDEKNAIMEILKTGGVRTALQMRD